MRTDGIGQLVALVRGQRQHDERAHRDVYYLPSVRRITHLAQHVSKYAARLLSGQSSVEPDRQVVERTIVDTTLIALSSTELLRIDLATLAPPEATAFDLVDLGQYRVKLAGEAAGELQWLVHRLVAIAGGMSKALESLDHLEAYPYREALDRCTVQLLDACLVAAATRGMDLSSLVHSRWEQLERSAALGTLDLEGPIG